MRRRGLLNLILVVAVAGLLGLLTWQTSRQEPAAEPITQLNRQAIKHIRIDYPDAPTLKLEKSGDGWRITAPVSGRAETSEVKQILRLAEETAQRSYPVSDIDAGEVGLADPKYTVTLDDTQIALGANDPLERNRYARVGDTVYLIEDPNILAIDADYSNLLARDLLPENAELSRLELPDGITLTPTETGGWAVQPEADDRGADAAQQTVDAWRRARAMWIKPAVEQQTALATVKLHIQAGQTYTYEVVAREPQLILRRPQLKANYHVAVNQAGPLLRMEHDQKQEKSADKPSPDGGLSP